MVSLLVSRDISRNKVEILDGRTSPGAYCRHMAQTLDVPRDVTATTLRTARGKKRLSEKLGTNTQLLKRQGNVQHPLPAPTQGAAPIANNTDITPTCTWTATFQFSEL